MAGEEVSAWLDESGRFKVWPDNWEAVQLFTTLMTQWRIGFSGATGLDYGVLPAVLRLRGTARSKWSALFNDLRILEAEALETMREADDR